MNTVNTAELFAAAPAGPAVSRPAPASSGKPAQKEFGKVLKEVSDREKPAAAKDEGSTAAARPADSGEPKSGEANAPAAVEPETGRIPVKAGDSAEEIPEDQAAETEVPADAPDASVGDAGKSAETASVMAAMVVASTVVEAVVAADPLEMKGPELAPAAATVKSEVPEVQDTVLRTAGNQPVPETAKAMPLTAEKIDVRSSAVPTADETAQQSDAVQPAVQAPVEPLTQEALVQQMRAAAHVQGDAAIQPAAAPENAGAKNALTDAEGKQTVETARKGGNGTEQRIATDQPVEMRVVRSASADGGATAQDNGRNSRQSAAAAPAEAHGAKKAVHAEVLSAASVDPLAQTAAPAGSQTLSGLSGSIKAEAVSEPSVSAANPAEMIDRIVKGAEMATRNGRSEMVLRLEPENLGKVHLRITANHDMVSIHIRTQSSEARDMVESHMTQLAGALGDQGLKIERASVSVDIGSGQNQGFGYQGFGAYQGQGNTGDGTFRQFAQSYAAGMPDSLSTEAVPLPFMTSAASAMTGLVNYLV